MTFTEMKSMLQALGYGTDSDTQQGLLINSAYRRICNRRAWSWLRSNATTTLTPGTREYTWTDFGISSNPPRRLESLRIIDATVSPSDVIPLIFLDPQEFDKFAGYPTAVWPVSERDIPTYWTRRGNVGVALWSPPDLAYVAHLAYTAPAAVLSGVGEPAMPRDFHDAIVYEAAHAMALRQRDTGAIQEMRAERDYWLTQLEAEDSVASQSRERVAGQDLWRDRRY